MPLPTVRPFDCATVRVPPRSALSQAAVQDLEHLRDTSPDESNVLFQLARAYRLKGDKVKFAQLLAEVHDVAPKSAAKIRKLVDAGQDADMDEG